MIESEVDIDKRGQADLRTLISGVGLDKVENHPDNQTNQRQLNARLRTSLRDENRDQASAPAANRDHAV